MDFITPAFAQAGAPAGSDAITSLIIPMALMIAIFYFLIIRPQQARAKSHREMMEKVRRGDTVVTSGGFVGKVTKVTDDFVVVEISDNVELKFQKQAIAATLPKGTLKSI